VLFQLLCVDTGSFTFDPHADVPAGKPVDLEPLLSEAQARLAEWQLIEAVVPSMATAVDLADELPSPKATVTSAQWRVLRAIAAGVTVDDVARALDLDEFHACQAVKRLVDAGLVVVGDGMAEVDDEIDDVEEEEDATESEVTREVEADSDDDSDELVSIPDHLRGNRRRFAGPEPEPEARQARLSPMAIAAARRRAELAQQTETAALSDQYSDDLVGATAAALTPENAKALVRELAELGGTGTSQAAEAIEAASRAPSTEERAAALEGVLANDEGEPLSRALLVKFLSSVRS